MKFYIYIYLSFFILSNNSFGASSLCLNLFKDTEEIKASYATTDVLMKYEEGRDLSYYLKSMPKEFVLSLMNVIKQGGHILDAGSGIGVFANEIAFGSISEPKINSDRKLGLLVKKIRKLSERSRPLVTAITARSFSSMGSLYDFKKVSNFISERYDTFRQFAGRLFEEIPNSEIISKFNKVDLITDMWGVMAYSHDLHIVLKKYHDLLNDRGEVYIRVSGIGEGSSTMMKDTIIVGTQKIPLVNNWLSSIKGFQFEFIQDESGSTVKLTKNDDPFYIQPLVFISKSPNLPPIRTFRIE